jgi:putative radical SAM enzyme (TIGR03279 family)
MTRAGIKIREVEAGSIAADLGIQAGDEILTVNGRPIPDELALKFWLAEELVDVEVRKPTGEERVFEVDLTEYGNLGIKVEDFRTRTCNNACLFCFIDQLPPGVRPSLQIKDDDYRLSFLHGNYITLTNLPERELDRILEQALSPLYVSVHATDPDLRTFMLGRRKTDDLERKMKKLIAGGIRLHTQVVLMPEINDGAHLQNTVQDLYGYYPGVDSIAIVPLGLSDHGRPHETCKPVTARYCRELVDQVAPWQERFRSETGRTFAYLADEFYIQGGLPLPPSVYYDDFTQIEDGVGMVRRFLDEFEAETARRRRPMSRLRGTLATARLFYPFLKDCIGRFNLRFRSNLEVREVANHFMGKNITVAGLLAGQDFLAALKGSELGDFVIVPEEAISRIDGIFVDNMSPMELEQKLGKPVLSGGRTAKDLFQHLSRKV